MDSLKTDWLSEGKTEKPKSQILEYARKLYPSPRFSIYKKADTFCTNKFNLKILFFPVARTDINVIEFEWSIF